VEYLNWIGWKIWTGFRIFGLLHLAGLAGQVVEMFMHTTLKIEPKWSFASSLLMSNLYLAFLTAYVGGKEFLRWFKKEDEVVLSATDAKKVSRGVWFVIVWAVFAGAVVFGWQMGLIAEVPNLLIVTLTEVVALFGGTEASKFLKSQQAGQSKQDSEMKANYAERVAAYCREKGSISNAECQRECGLSEDQASRLLARLVKDKVVKASGEGRGRRYTLA